MKPALDPEVRKPSRLLISLIFGSAREIEQSFSRIDRLLSARHPWIVFITSGLRKNALAEAVSAAEHFSWPAGREKARLIIARFGSAFSDSDWIRLFSASAKKGNFMMADMALASLAGRGAADALRACSASMESMGISHAISQALAQRHSARIMAMADQIDIVQSISNRYPKQSSGSARL